MKLTMVHENGTNYKADTQMSELGEIRNDEAPRVNPL